MHLPLSRSEKLVKRFIEVPKDFTWEEFINVIAYFGFKELKTGKTGGSRRKFVDDEKHIISLHKPHPRNIVKRYAIEETIVILKKLHRL
ncbi:type II toxin-antitoxin system HicA family toxin [Parapedobacter tibetensis]|uniref:type II toxin-antitoxin system HicA family toxin n=1 Tax=Parapedobacter tibetensis TaxID=2972951 RepID=UPI00356B68B1